MASVMDMDGNFLVLEEIVLRDRVYKLEQFRQFYDLQPVGELRLMNHKLCIITTDFFLKIIS